MQLGILYFIFNILKMYFFTALALVLLRADDIRAQWDKAFTDRFVNNMTSRNDRKKAKFGNVKS